MEIKVEKGIPIIERRSPRERKLNLPFEELQVDDSFFVPYPEEGIDRELACNIIRNCIRHHRDRVQKVTDMVFVTRTIFDKKRKAEGIRVWRTA